MSQAVDLPQLSLQRYFDLVKRRRWQLIPVSLLGLAIGGLVAFFIPRFYVAQTVLSHQQLPGADPTVEHPFRGIVDSARSTIPLAVGEALDQMEWPDVQVLDPYSRQQYERELESRVYVNDANAYLQKRDYALLHVTYKDQDGARSAEFLNKLVEVWIEKRIAEIREPAEQERQRAKDEAAGASKVYDDLLGEKQRIEREYGILPNAQLDLGLQRQRMQEESAANKARTKDLLKKRTEHGVFGKRIEAASLELDAIEPRVPPDQADLAEQLKGNKPALVKYLQAQHFMIAASAFRVGHPEQKRFQRMHELTMQQLRILVPQGEVGPDGMVDNPEYEKKRAAIDEMIAKQVALGVEIAEIERQVEVDSERQERMTLGYELYSRKLTYLADAKRQYDEAQEALTAADKVLGQLQRRLPVKVERFAQVPPEPTEPNILVVAIIGCILGLGAAIGLILAFDLLQGSFKTVDDVERGLSVPVLGGISHLETEEERVTAVRGRRRVSIVAAALLLMTTVVVTLYYIVPTRLPPVVVDLLSMVLGSGSRG